MGLSSKTRMDVVRHGAAEILKKPQKWHQSVPWGLAVKTARKFTVMEQQKYAKNRKMAPECSMGFSCKNRTEAFSHGTAEIRKKSQKWHQRVPWGPAVNTARKFTVMEQQK